MARAMALLAASPEDTVMFHARKKSTPGCILASSTALTGMVWPGTSSYPPVVASGASLVQKSLPADVQLRPSVE